MRENYATEGHPISAVLRKRGIRKDWFAGRVGIQKWTLSRYLAGVVTPPDEFYARAALILDCEPDELRPAEQEPVAAA